MFTVKYRTFECAKTQLVEGPCFFDMHEHISGPYEQISQEYQDGYMVVHAHREGGAPGYTFGPIFGQDESTDTPPRPTLWVMNEQGATVAKYDL